MKRRDFHRLAASAAALLAWPAAEAAPVEGKDYTRISPPVPLAVPGKLEVIEFFGYWCPHCFAFEPTIEAWAAKLPANVNFRRVPVAWQPIHLPYQKLYYALESLGVPETIHRKVFDAVHVQHLRLDQDAGIAAFAASNGIDKKKLVDAMNSFSVAADLNKAKALFAAYHVDGVPTLAVDGRYVTSPEQAGGETQALAVVDALLRMPA